MLKEGTLQDVKDIAKLALLLWPNHTLEELSEEMTHLINQPTSKVFLAYHENKAIGFAHCELRYDYVEGTHSNPVGYLEGIFVEKSFRMQGYARDLLNACEKWAKKKGCHEFASDCELGNEDSLAMHMNLGFAEVNRIICLKKDL